LNFDLKRFLKTVKLNENNISMVLGALVIVIVGVLVVNYFKDRNPQTIPGISTSENEVGGDHTVVSGETLWSIAEDNYGSGYNWVDISEANSLTSDYIEVGQVLSIPDVPTKEPTVTQTISAGEETSKAISGDSYTVAKGDSLWDISVRAYGDGYKWVEIAEANNLVNPNVIHAGNVLSLPR
jgi:nucleoid-associated protein YgaU